MIQVRDDQTFQQLPPLSAYDLSILRESIRTQGLLEPIVVDENGYILDGFHRAMLCRELGVALKARVLSGLSVDEKREYALLVNWARRQLHPYQRQVILKKAKERVFALLGEDATQSNYAIARLVGTNEENVRLWRAEAEQTIGIERVRRRGNGPTRSLERSLNWLDPEGRHSDNAYGAPPTVRLVVIDGQERWNCEFVMATPMPGAAGIELQKFAAELATHFAMAAREKPLHSMATILPAVEREGTLVSKVSDFLRSCNSARVSEIQHALHEDIGSIGTTLANLRKAGKVERLDAGLYHWIGAA
jgi:hypothetical protein